MSLLKVLLAAKCEEHDVAPKLVASSDDIDRLSVEEEPDVPALTGWRRRVFGDDALALKGRTRGARCGGQARQADRGGVTDGAWAGARGGPDTGAAGRLLSGVSDWLGDLHAALASADPDQALARFASAEAWLASLPVPQTPPVFVGLSMIAGALFRVGRGTAVRPFLGMAPDPYWPGRTHAPDPRKSGGQASGALDSGAARRCRGR